MNEIINTTFGQRVSIPTRKEFHENSHLKSTEAFVDNIGKDAKYGTYLILSNTVFYPHGGGQKGDRGQINLSSSIADMTNLPSILHVKDTRKEGQYILHIIDGIESFDEELVQEHLLGNKVSLTIDWEFRFKQMRLHSIAHLLHFFAEQEAKKQLPYPSTSDLQDGFGFNRYDEPNVVADESAKAIYDNFQEFIRKNIDISTYAQEDNTEIRYWKCDDYVVPCGGTHLNNVSQIGNFDLDIQTKKGKTTMKFTLA